MCRHKLSNRIIANNDCHSLGIYCNIIGPTQHSFTVEFVDLFLSFFFFFFFFVVYSRMSVNNIYTY